MSQPNQPLQPQTPIQRLGWIRGKMKLLCKKDGPTWKAGREYESSFQTTRVTTRGDRKTKDGHETVSFIGTELLIYVSDDKGDRHRFLPNPPTTHRLIHDFETLVEFFEIPEIPDIAESNPEAYQIYVQRLRALESKS